jgi:hypothetical protein
LGGEVEEAAQDRWREFTVMILQVFRRLMCFGDIATVPTTRRDAAAVAVGTNRLASSESISASGEGTAISLQLRECCCHMVLHLLNVFQDALMQLDKDERLAKLEETFDSVCEDYKRILAMAL